MQPRKDKEFLSFRKSAMDRTLERLHKEGSTYKFQQSPTGWAVIARFPDWLVPGHSENRHWPIVDA